MRNLLKIFIAVAIIVTASCTLEPHYDLTFTGPPQTSAVRCGSRLTTASGELSYKRFEIAEPNERCVWILRTDGATSASVSMVNLDTPNTVSVLALGLTDKQQEWIPSNTGDEAVLEDTNMIVVTFHTGANSSEFGRGFVISYKFFTNGTNTKASTKSMDYLYAEDIGHVKYPVGNTNYDNHELSVLVFNPFFNHLDVNDELKVIYIKSVMELNVDYVQVYSFQQGWKMLGKITNDVEIIRGSDIIMLVFQTDNTNTYSGFQVTYTQSPKCSCAIE